MVRPSVEWSTRVLPGNHKEMSMPTINLRECNSCQNRNIFWSTMASSLDLHTIRVVHHRTLNPIIDTKIFIARFFMICFMYTWLRPEITLQTWRKKVSLTLKFVKWNRTALCNSSQQHPWVTERGAIRQQAGDGPNVAPANPQFRKSFLFTVGPQTMPCKIGLCPRFCFAVN